MNSDTDKVGLSQIVSPKLDAPLNELDHKLNGATSAVLRREISLVKVILDAKEQGKKAGITDKNQPLSKKTMGI